MALKGDVVKQYLERFPDAKTLTLAKLIYKENPKLFTDVENARTRVRHYRGAMGERMRNELADTRFVRPLGKQGEVFVSFPEGFTTLDEWKIVKYTGDKKILVLSDVHVPFHDHNALSIAVNYGLKKGVDTLFLNGDFLDHYSQSRWIKDPRKRDFPQEVETAKTMFGILREAFPKARIIFKEGNHEERYQAYMEIKAPELLGIPDFNFENVFHLRDYNIEWIDQKKPVKFNELFIIHGHEYKTPFYNPVNPARGLFNKAKVNAMCGHLHQPSSHSEQDLDGKHIGCWSVGHLAEEHPRYMPLNKWSHGFAIVETCGTKKFQVDNYKIIEGEIFRA